MSSDLNKQIRSAMDARDLRVAAERQHADEAEERDRTQSATVLESWENSRESIARPVLSQAAATIREGGSEAIVNETTDHVGVTLEITPNGDTYSPTLTILPDRAAGTITAHASIGTANRSVPVTAFTEDWLEAVVGLFVDDVFGETARPSRNW